MMRTKSKYVVSLLLFSLLASACAAPAVEAPATEVPAVATEVPVAEAAEPTPAPEPTAIVSNLGTGSMKLAFWNGLTGSDGVTLTAMLEGFVKDHPEISITQEVIPWNTLYTKLQAAFVANQPPDVFILHASEIPQFSGYGVLKDLESFYTTGGGFLSPDDLSKVSYEGMQFEGKTYGIPLDNHGRGLWINLGAFEKAKVDPNAPQPTNYEGWVSLFQKLTLDKNGKNAAAADFDPENVVQWGFAVGEWPRVNLLSALEQNGAKMVSSDNKKIEINSDAGVKSLQQFVDLVYKYKVSPPAAGFDTWQGYSTGAVAVLPTGSWFRNFAIEQTDIKGMAWPNFQFGPKKATWFGVHTWMVPVNLEGEKLEAVKTLIQWACQTDNQMAWAGSGQVPALLSSQAKLDSKTYPSNITFGKTFSEYGFIDYVSTVTQELYSALDPEIDAALNNTKSAKQALDDAAQRMQEILDRNK
jgi:ABC-type glycerol-3-phosphate transport system substrate-binding protein